MNQGVVDGKALPQGAGGDLLQVVPHILGGGLGTHDGDDFSVVADRGAVGIGGEEQGGQGNAGGTA